MHGYIPAIDEAESEADIRRYMALRILQAFDAFYTEFCEIPDLARAAFEARDHATSLKLSRDRISFYSRSIAKLAPNLASLLPQDAAIEQFWQDVESAYLSLIQSRYEADLAFAYLHSFRRAMHQGEWKPVDYTFHAATRELTAAPQIDANDIYATFELGADVQHDTVDSILALARFNGKGVFVADNNVRVAKRLNQIVYDHQRHGGKVLRIEFIKAGFYRNRGAYLVGRGIKDDASVIPLVFALLNSEEGMYVDAILDTEADAHNIFSSTLANFHVTSIYYHELCSFLYTIMPSRPLGLHYSTIGFNHFGKVAVMQELRDELRQTGHKLSSAVGFQGTVAIGFASPQSAYNLKVIRNHPTQQYKWGKFEGIDSVLAKYRRVHEINRTGSMLDSIIYVNVKLRRDEFDPELLALLLDAASDTVSVDGDELWFRHLIVQRKMTPLPVFLDSASADDTEQAIVNLGFCIKNNTAANIFNKDLDARNYGVSRFLKVYLYDYDALEPFVSVKIRTNVGREDGEDDIPEWFFEDGVVFLPEELESGLMLNGRHLVRAFRKHHGDLLTVDYWEDVQSQLRAGKVPAIRIYPQSQELLPSAHDDIMDAEISEGFYSPQGRR